MSFVSVYVTYPTRLKSAIQNYFILYYLIKIVCETQILNVYYYDIKKSPLNVFICFYKVCLAWQLFLYILFFSKFVIYSSHFPCFVIILSYDNLSRKFQNLNRKISYQFRHIAFIFIFIQKRRKI